MANISGKVTDQQNGVVIQNASVTVTDGAGYTMVGQTNVQGDYDIKVKAGTYTVSVQVPVGYQNPQPMVGIAISAGESSKNNDFRLQPQPPQPQAITGQVIDAAGNPVAATVTATDGAGVALPAVQTDNLGNYTIPVPAPGNYSVAVQAPANYQNPGPQPAVVIAGQAVAPVNFQLQFQPQPQPPQPQAITGRVLDANGNAVANAQVTATDGAGVAQPAVQTDNLGNYTIPVPAPGNYSVAVQAPANYHVPLVTQVVVTAGQAVPPVNFQLQPIFSPNDGQGFIALRDLFRIKKDRFAPEPPVNLDEAGEMTRLYMAGTLVFAGIPSAITTLFNSKQATQPFNGITLQRLQGKSQWGSGDLVPPKDLATLATEIRENSGTNGGGPTDNKTDLMRALRSAFAFGRASVDPPINSEFLSLFQRFVELSTDDRNGIDPDKIKPGQGGGTVLDPRQYEQVRAFLRDYKRSIIRLVNNLSDAGTAGTKDLSEKWAGIVGRSLVVIDDVASHNVVSYDKDARYAWSVLAALTGKDRGYVKKFIVHADSGTQLLRDAIAIYDKIQALGLLSKEDDKTLRDLFLTQGLVFPHKTVAEQVLESASILKDNWINDWNFEA